MTTKKASKKPAKPKIKAKVKPAAKIVSTDDDPHMGRFSEKKLAAVAASPNSAVQKVAQERLAKPEIPAGTHAEEQLAIEQGNKQYGSLRTEAGKAVLTIDVPAHQKEVVLAFSQIPGCAIAAVQAWDAVRAFGDAPFAQSVTSHQMKLVSHAESIYKGGNPMSGDTALAKFEREVARIKSEQDKEKQS